MRAGAIMAASHERSGTHFIMNTLAVCFDYVSNQISTGISSTSFFERRTLFECYRPVPPTAIPLWSLLATNLSRQVTSQAG
jgi:hypothetical protein